MNSSSGKRYRSSNKSTSSIRCVKSAQQHLKCVKMFTQRFLVAYSISTLILLTIYWPPLVRQVTATGEVGDLDSNGINRGPDKQNEASLLQSHQSSDSWMDPSEERLINTAPRQYFKLHITPGRSNKRSIHKQTVRRSFNQSSTIDNQNNANPASVAKQKISNATLKKLLNQSLMKSTLNGNSSNNQIKGSNFKFVFIQRSPTTSNTNKGESTSGKVTSGKTSSSSNVNQAQPSLAASVSKHLANTLLNSAVSMMGNLSNSAPSLSSIASHIVTHSLGDSSFASSNRSSINQSTSATKQQSDSSASDDDDKNKNSLESSEKDKDRNRLSFAGAYNTKTKQPSKVYNLPVKFVTDGQPYHAVVLSTIKKHFATIKRLQQANNSNNNELHTTSNSNDQVKRRKNQQSYQKLKGNSRFIYLPLKYLSNARPSKVISSKTLHKSLS